MNVVGQERPRLRPAQDRQARHDRHRQARRPAATGDAGRHRRQDRAAEGASTPSRSAARTAPRSGTPTMGNDLDVVADHQGRRSRSRRRTPTSRYRTWYDIEAGYDYGYVEVSDDGGATWDHGRQDVHRHADTGHWAATQTVDLSAYAGKDVRIRFEYMTDGGVALSGWEVTDVAVGGRRPRRESAFATDGWMRVDGEWTAEDRPLLHRRVPHLRRLRREPQELLPVELQLRRAGSTGSATTRVCTSSTATRSTPTTTWPRTSATAAGWSSTPTRSPTASPTATARPTTWATGGRASRCATRRSASSPTQDAEHLLRRLRRGAGRRREHRPRQGAPSRGSTTPRTYWYADVARGRGQDPQEPRRAHQRQVHGAPTRMTIWVDNVK